MMGTWRQIWQVTMGLLVAAAIGVADTSGTSNNNPPPGTLNYVEGQVSVQGQKQSPKSVGSTYLEPNQVLDTRNGNAEMLLTPGIFMRIGHNSEVKMISPGLADTQVQLTSGSAMLEVDELFKENNVSVVVDGATTRIEKQGLYDFNANPPSVKVLDGKAVTFEGDQKVKLKKGHETLLAEAQPLVQQKYNKDQIEDDPLYRWSKLRSDYATESNVDAANALMMDGGWWGPGWYWDPFWWDFAFMPGFGMGWGAFGYPFFSPWMVGLCALLVLATGVGTAATTIIRPPEGAAVGACRRSHISPRRDQPDSALYREPWRAVAWECGWVVSAVVPWEASTVVPWEGSTVVA